MVSADVAARAAAPVTTSADARSRTSTARRADALLDRGDRFAGHYVCAQGRTEATLVIEDLVDGTDVSAIFEFDYPGGGGDHAPASGSFRMHGSVDPGTGAMHLDGDRWIEEPDGYVMVSLLGTVSKTGSISGTVKGPGCSSFYLEGSARGAAKRSAGLR
ncbi:MAG: hypothetical protein JWO86_6980 [Myxococcaceae bacterium]|nr:hypothetical protein [Myxococcaceae bacterium]MEA2752277.1 hypothetical protein [Myxococcales bacterium]